MKIFTIYILTAFSASLYAQSDSTQGQTKILDKNILTGFSGKQSGNSTDDNQTNLSSKQVMGITVGTVGITGMVVGGALAYNKKKNANQDQKTQKVEPKSQIAKSNKLTSSPVFADQSKISAPFSQELDPKIKLKTELKEQLKSLIDEHKDLARNETGYNKVIGHLDAYQRHVENMIEAKSDAQFTTMDTTISTRFHPIEGIHDNVHQEVKKITHEARKLL